MITITFNPDVREVEEFRAQLPARPEVLGGLLEETALEMPVEFSIGDTSLFSTGQAPAPASLIRTPIVGFARAGIRAVRELAGGWETICSLPGTGMDITFAPLDPANVVVIYHTTSARCDKDELDQAFQKFCSDVSAFINEQFPEIIESDYWKWWRSETGIE